MLIAYRMKRQRRERWEEMYKTLKSLKYDGLLSLFLKININRIISQYSRH